MCSNSCILARETPLTDTTADILYFACQYPGVSVAILQIIGQSPILLPLPILERNVTSA